MAGKLEGKVAFVTGASSGIGEATAIALAAEGAKVAIIARRGDRLQALAERIAAHGGQALPLVADVTDETQVNHAVEEAIAQLGGLDIVVNNAGIAVLGNIDTGNPSEWRRSFEVNVFGVLYVTKATVPFLRQQQSGHIVNISSVAGRTARAGVGVYNATKWGVNGFSEALRQEVHQDNIRVTIIEPGLVDTEINDLVSDPIAKQRFEERRKAITPLQSEDIPKAVPKTK